MPIFSEVLHLVVRACCVLAGATVVWFKWGLSKDGLQAYGVHEALGHFHLTEGWRYAIELIASLVMCTFLGMILGHPESWREAVTAGMSSTALLARPRKGNARRGGAK